MSDLAGPVLGEVTLALRLAVGAIFTVTFVSPEGFLTTDDDNNEKIWLHLAN